MLPKDLDGKEYYADIDGSFFTKKEFWSFFFISAITVPLWAWWYYPYLLIKKLVGIKEEKQYQEAEKLAECYKSLVGLGDLVFDIGAYNGTYLMAFKRLNARVVSVEPQSKLAERLKKKFKNDSWTTIVAKGVSEKSGKKELNICPKYRNISTFSGEWERGFPGKRYNKTEMVDVISLDDMVEQYGLPKYCKIDAEGSENDILKGLTSPIPYISIEKDWREENNAKNKELMVFKGYREIHNVCGKEEGKNLFFKKVDINQIKNHERIFCKGL